MQCLFCKIISGEVPSEKIYEDEHAFAFLDIHPAALGHAMVVPKVHAEALEDLPSHEIGPLFEAVKKVSCMIQRAVQCAGMNVGANIRRAAGQEVDHLHIHIIPRWPDDGGSSIQSIVRNQPEEDLKTTAEKIRIIQ